MRTISEQLINLRESKNLKQKDIAEKFNVAPSTWSNYENEWKTPPLDLLDRVCKEFHVSLDYITGVTNLKYNPRDPDFEKLMIYFIKMDQKQRKELLDLAKKLGGK